MDDAELAGDARGAMGFLRAQPAHNGKIGVVAYRPLQAMDGWTQVFTFHERYSRSPIPAGARAGR